MTTIPAHIQERLDNAAREDLEHARQDQLAIAKQDLETQRERFKEMRNLANERLDMMIDQEHEIARLLKEALRLRHVLEAAKEHNDKLVNMFTVQGTAAASLGEQNMNRKGRVAELESENAGLRIELERALVPRQAELKKINELAASNNAYFKYTKKLEAVIESCQCK